jgi:hypothetical protein
LQALRQAHAELTRTATAPAWAASGLGLDGHGGLATAQDHAGLLKGALAFGGGAGQGGMHLAHFARFAFDLVAQDVGVHAHGTGRVCRSLQRLLRRGRHVDAVACKHR